MSAVTSSPAWFETVGYICLTVFLIALAVLALCAAACFCYCMICNVHDEIENKRRRKQYERH